MRCFIGLEVPDAQANTLSRLVDRLSVGRIVPAENLHLTLAFLGDVSNDDLTELHEALTSLSAPGFPLKIKGLDVFGRRPRAIWAGVEPNASLTHLQSKVTSAARRAGLTLERRRFVPHVTLTRFRQSEEAAPHVAQIVATHAAFELSPLQVRTFALFSSHLRSDGAQYDVLERYPLEAPIDPDL